MIDKSKITGRCPFCGGKMEGKHGFYGGLYFYCQNDECRATRVTPQYGPAPGGGSGISKPVEDAFVQAMETEEEIAAEISKAAGLLREIRSAIDAVPDAIQREVLKRRYIGMQSLEKIAVEMNYSYAHVLRLHGWALQQVVVPSNDARSC